MARTNVSHLGNANHSSFTPGSCRRSEIDRASRTENRGLPTRPTRIRYKADYANAHRTRPMTEKPAEWMEGWNSEKKYETGWTEWQARKDKGGDRREKETEKDRRR